MHSEQRTQHNDTLAHNIYDKKCREVRRDKEAQQRQQQHDEEIKRTPAAKQTQYSLFLFYFDLNRYKNIPYTCLLYGKLQYIVWLCILLLDEYEQFIYRMHVCVCVYGGL